MSRLILYEAFVNRFFDFLLFFFSSLFYFYAHLVAVSSVVFLSIIVIGNRMHLLSLLKGKCLRTLIRDVSISSAQNRPSTAANVPVYRNIFFDILFPLTFYLLHLKMLHASL